MKFLKGRLNRINFWGGLGFVFLVYPLILIILDTIFENYSLLSSVFDGLSLLYLILISLSITIRRLHDVNKSGFYIFLLLIPIANLLVPIWLVSTKGSVGINKYGDEDKGFSIKHILSLE